MNIYYKADFGCIICPETHMGNTPMRVVIDPVTLLDRGFTTAMLGEAVLRALERSRTAPPVPRADLGAGRFWQITGIKGFAAFSRKFQCVDLRDKGVVLEASRLIREVDGGYVWSKDQPSLEISTEVSAAQLGAEILALFSPGPDFPANETQSFETVYGNTVTYRRPSDAFEDRGDGHTDAYQIFILEDAPQSYIAFLINSGYAPLHRAAVLENWQERYGPFSEFCFRHCRKPPLLASMRGKTAEAEIISHVYQDGEGTLEVLARAETALPSEAQETVRAEYQALIRSILIREIGRAE